MRAGIERAHKYMCQTGNPRNCFFHSLYGHAKSLIDDPLDPKERERESRLRIETHSELFTAVPIVQLRARILYIRETLFSLFPVTFP